MVAARCFARRHRPRLWEIGIALIVGACGALSQVPTLAAWVAVAGMLLVWLAPRG